MEKILVMGATGLLGSTLVEFLKNLTNYQVITHSHKKEADFNFDVSKFQETNKLISKIKPDAIINLIGLTSVEECQNNPNLAYLLNCKTVENIVTSISNANLKTHFLHISSDHLYDGDGPHYEENICIKNNYAFSKYTGEIIAQRIDSSIIRTNFVGKSRSLGRESMTDWLYNSLKNNKKISVFEDVKFNPLSMNSVSYYIREIIEKKPVGIFNLGSHNGMSKANFDFIFAERMNLDTSQMTRMSVDNVDWDMALRPKDMRMKLDKIEKRLGIKLPTLEDEIKEIAKEYN